MHKIALAIGHNFAKETRWSSPDRGASAFGTTEADITKMLIDTLVKRGVAGFEIVKVPEGLNISQRNKWVNDRSGELSAYFELHLDSATPAASGCSTYFVGGNSWAEGEARQFQMAYTRVTGMPGRGIKADTTNRWGRLGAIRDIKIFGLLMELGFISNVNDLQKIKTKGVEAIATGISEMFAK